MVKSRWTATEGSLDSSSLPVEARTYVEVEQLLDYRSSHRATAVPDSQPVLAVGPC